MREGCPVSPAQCSGVRKEEGQTRQVSPRVNIKQKRTQICSPINSLTRIVMEIDQISGLSPTKWLIDIIIIVTWSCGDPHAYSLPASPLCWRCRAGSSIWSLKVFLKKTFKIMTFRMTTLRCLGILMEEGSASNSDPQAHSLPHRVESAEQGGVCVVLSFFKIKLWHSGLSMGKNI